jgi:hypothetical protein
VACTSADAPRTVSVSLWVLCVCAGVEGCGLSRAASALPATARSSLCNCLSDRACVGLVAPSGLFHAHAGSLGMRGRPP